MSSRYNIAIDYLSKNDVILKCIIEKVGECTLEPSESYFRNILISVVSQQLSISAARSIWMRFENLLGERIDPKLVINIDNSKIRETGISNKKAEYVKDIAKYFMNKPEFSDEIKSLTDEEVIRELTSVRGIGTWTAQMFLIFSLCRQNVLPFGDVGFKRSIKIHYDIKKDVEILDVLRISEKWGNYKSIAVWYLWKGLDDNVDVNKIKNIW